MGARQLLLTYYWTAVSGPVVADLIAGTVEVEAGILAGPLAIPDSGCRGYPTPLIAEYGWVEAASDTYPGVTCYPWEQDPPVWAGEARGLFKFNAHAVPARTHGGLASQDDIEARLGRSIPDPTNPEGEVFYWDPYPVLFHVRNESADDVDAVFTRSGGCAEFTQQVLASETRVIGPFWGDASHVVVQLVGPDPGSGGALTVPAGVYVRVTQPVEADPGETFADFACSAPVVV
jgi:hypothetical protein